MEDHELLELVGKFAAAIDGSRMIPATAEETAAMRAAFGCDRLPENSVNAHYERHLEKCRHQAATDLLHQLLGREPSEAEVRRVCLEE